MAKRTLYDTAQLFRKIVVYAILAIIVILVIDTILKSLTFTNDPFSSVGSFYVQRSEFDEVEVPELPLSTLQIENDTPNFLVEGVFPDSPDTAFVYTIERPTVKLDYETNAVNTATSLGFIPGDGYTSTNPPRNTNLVWENINATRTLRFNAESLIWQMRTEYFNDPIALQPKTLLTDEASYQGAAVRMLDNIGLATGYGFSNPNVIAKLAKLGRDALFSNPINAANADYVVADIFRVLPLARLKPSNQRPTVPDNFTLPAEFDGQVYKEDPRQGSARMVLSNTATNSAADIYEIDFTDFEYRENALVREVITVEEAWTKVRQGEGKLRLLKNQTADYFADNEVLSVEKFVVNASATRMGIFEPSNWDGFAYPIYVFSGRAELSNGLNGEFVFYMDAINRDIVNFK